MNGPLNPNADARIAEIWRAQHRFLIDVAYRMLGSVSDAEDIVQEAFTRLMRVDPSEIDDERAWLVVVVSRLCVDYLRSARVRREQYVGPWLPEPLVGSGDSADPADRITLDESIRMALLIVLEQLTPAERAAFVLHDVFQFSFDIVSSIVGRSPAACRQLASRARRHIEANVGPTRFSVEPSALQRVAERFVAACANGSVDALLDVLDPAVEGAVDIGGRHTPFGNGRSVGAEIVAERLLLLFGPRTSTQLVVATVNGEPGVAALHNDHVMAVMALSINDDERIVEINSVADPAKLERVPSDLS